MLDLSIGVCTYTQDYPFAYMSVKAGWAFDSDRSSAQAHGRSGLIFPKHEIHCADDPLICAAHGFLTEIVPFPEKRVSGL